LAVILLVVLRLVILRRLFKEQSQISSPPRAPALSTGNTQKPRNQAPYERVVQRSLSRSKSNEHDYSSDEDSNSADSDFARSLSRSSSSSKAAMKRQQSTNLGLRKPVPAEEGSILVVDDNQINQMLSAKMLQRYFADVDIPSDGQEALDLLSNSKTYIAVFLDIAMPVMDGLACAKRIREMSKYKDVPIIVVSANLNLLKGSDLITETISKPISLGDFETVIGKLNLLEGYDSSIYNPKFE